MFASFGPLVRVLSEMFGTYAQVAARMGLAFVFLLLLSLVRGSIKRLSKSQVLRAIFLGLVSSGIIVFFTIAITEIKIASSVFFLYIGSMVTSLILGSLIFKENLGWQKITAIILAFMGLILFVLADMDVALGFGALAALLSGVGEGVGNGIRKGLKEADKTSVTLIQFSVITVAVSLLILVSGETVIREINTASVIALIVFSSLQLLLNYLLLYGFQNFDVNIGTVILSMELFFAAVLGYFFFGETLTLYEILGGVTIFLASVVATVEFKKGNNLN